MHWPATNQPDREQIPLERFFELRIHDLRNILAELATGRARRESSLNPDAIEALIRVMDRDGYQTVSRLGPEAANAWARRAGVV